MDLTPNTDGPANLSYDFYVCMPSDIWKIMATRFIKNRKDFVSLKFTNKFLSNILTYEVYTQFYVNLINHRPASYWSFKSNIDYLYNIARYTIWRTPTPSIITSEDENQYSCIFEISGKAIKTYTTYEPLFKKINSSYQGRFLPSSINYNKENNYLDLIKHNMNIIRNNHIPILIQKLDIPQFQLIIVICVDLYEDKGSFYYSKPKYSHDVIVKKQVLRNYDYQYIAKYCDDIAHEINNKIVVYFNSITIDFKVDNFD
jgi:hypothetical protein